MTGSSSGKLCTRTHPCPPEVRLPLEPLFQMNHMQASNPAQQRPTARTPATHTAAVNGIHMHSHFINTKIRPTCQTDRHTAEDKREEVHWAPGTLQMHGTMDIPGIPRSCGTGQPVQQPRGRIMLGVFSGKGKLKETERGGEGGVGSNEWCFRSQRTLWTVS